MPFIKSSILRTFCLFACVISNSYAASHSHSIDTLTALAQQNNLWTHPEWINLLHYNKNAFSDSYTSQVDDARFFNAADGKTNPQAELLATLTAFYQSDLTGNEHPQCKFVARLSWIKQQLPHDYSDLPAASCDNYREWRAAVADERVTMIFPAYHLNSPSSMYGHTLLRLDPAADKMESDWLSIAVNFGAEVHDEDNSLFYAFKGLAGGYPGYFIISPYYKKIREYNRHENRDIWEYPLNLTAEETRRMVEHLWELKLIKFDYFFFDENCSYRLLELLEVARPGVELTDEFVLTAIPVDTVRAIQRAGLTEGVSYRPSQATELKKLLTNTTPSHNDIILALAATPATADNAAFKNLSATDQRHAADLAYKYLRFSQGSTELDSTMANHRHQLLKLLNSYPATESPRPEYTAIQPDVGHHSKRATLGYGREHNQNFVEMSLKLSFHSLEDNAAGFLQGAQINIGSIQLRVTDDATKLQQFDLVDIFSLTPRNDFFHPWSWRVYTGLERQFTAQENRLVSHVSGGMGVAYEPIENNQTYALAIARIEHNRGFDDTIEPALGLMAGTLQHFGFNTMRLEISGEEFFNDTYRHRISYTHSFALGTNQSIRLQAKHQRQNNYDFNSVMLAYQHYF